MNSYLGMGYSRISYYLNPNSSSYCCTNGNYVIQRPNDQLTSLNFVRLFYLFICYTMTNAVATMDSSMLDDGTKTNRTPSVYDVLHKVSIYNPDYSRGETMDTTKQWLFKIKEAQTWEEKLINPFKFNLLAVTKVMSGNIELLNEWGDTLKNSKWETIKQYFYTNEFSQFTKKTDTIWFRNMTSKPRFFTKEDLTKMVMCPKINGKDNPFYEKKKKVDGSSYNSTVLKTQTLIFGKFVWGEYDGQFFQMYVKNSALWITYKDGENVEPEVWTFLYATEVQWLNAFNEVLKANDKPVVRSVKPNQLDLEVSIIDKDVSWKIYNVAVFDFAGLTGMRTNNLEDVEYISNLRNDYFVERFEGMRAPLKVEINNWNAVVDFEFEVEPEKWEPVKWLLEEAIDDIEEVEAMFEDPKAQAAHTEAKKAKTPF